MNDRLYFRLNYRGCELEVFPKEIGNTKVKKNLTVEDLYPVGHPRIAELPPGTNLDSLTEFIEGQFPSVYNNRKKANAWLARDLDVDKWLVQFYKIPTYEGTK